MASFSISFSCLIPAFSTNTLFAMLKLHTPTDIFKPIGPYAQAIEASAIDRILFISGTMGIENDGSIPEGFEAQANSVWSNIAATLHAAHMRFSNLAKLTIWLANRDDWLLAAQIRQRYLGDHKVAMSVVQVGLIDPKWLLEVEAIAVA